MQEARSRKRGEWEKARNERGGEEWERQPAGITTSCPNPLKFDFITVFRSGLV